MRKIALGIVSVWIIGQQNERSLLVMRFVFKFFLRTFVLFVGPLVPLFWTSGNISGFQSQSGQPYLHLVFISEIVI